MRTAGRPRRRRLAAHQPALHGANLERNLRIVDEVRAVAVEAEASPAQVALAWLLAQGDDVAPIPGTTRVARVEENVAAGSVVLTLDHLVRLDDLPAPSEERHDDAGMASIDH